MSINYEFQKQAEIKLETWDSKADIQSNKSFIYLMIHVS